MERLQQVLGHVRQALGQHPKLPHGDSLGMSRARALILWVPSQWAFKHSLACGECSFVWYHSPLMSHLEHGHVTLAQTIESLKIGRTLNSLSFR